MKNKKKKKKLDAIDKEVMSIGLKDQTESLVDYLDGKTKSPYSKNFRAEIDEAVKELEDRRKNSKKNT